MINEKLEDIIEKPCDSPYTITQGYLSIIGEHTDTFNHVADVSYTYSGEELIMNDSTGTGDPVFYEYQSDMDDDRDFYPFDREQQQEEPVLHSWQACPICKGTGFVPTYLEWPSNAFVYFINGECMETCLKCKGELVISKINGKCPSEI